MAGNPEKPRICTIHGGNGITTLNLKLFLPLLSEFCIIASDRDIFFPADKVFAKAEKIFKGPITTMKIDSLHLPDDATMEGVCKKTAEFFSVRNF